MNSEQGIGYNRPLFLYVESSQYSEDDNTHLSWDKFVRCTLFLFLCKFTSIVSFYQSSHVEWHERRSTEWNGREWGSNLGPSAPSLLIHKESNIWCCSAEALENANLCSQSRAAALLRSLIWLTLPCRATDVFVQKYWKISIASGPSHLFDIMFSILNDECVNKVSLNSRFRIWNCHY